MPSSRTRTTSVAAVPLGAQPDAAARGRVYLAALLSRLAKTCASRVGSPSRWTSAPAAARRRARGRAASMSGRRGLDGAGHAPRPASTGSLAQLDLAAADAGHVEQVVDQPHHLPQLPLHHVARLRQHRRVRRRRASRSDLERVADGRERVAQLVRERRQELVLAAVGLEQRLLRALELRDVVRAADVADERPVGGHARHAGRVQPAVLAVAARAGGPARRTAGAPGGRRR